MNWLPIFATDRLLLRPITLADVDAIFTACSNPHLTRYTLFDTHTCREASEAFVKTYALPQYAQRQLDPLGLALRTAPDQLIGSCGVMLSDQPHVREIGYWLAEPLWGQGYGTEVARKLVEIAFALPQVHRVQARVMVGNVASELVLLKAGFEFEGTIRCGLYRRGQFEDIKLYARIRDTFTTV